jgi:hypothetical protein
MKTYWKDVGDLRKPNSNWKAINIMPLFGIHTRPAAWLCISTAAKRHGSTRRA